MCIIFIKFFFLQNLNSNIKILHRYIFLCWNIKYNKYMKFYNDLFFQGKQIIKEDSLSNTENGSQCKADTGRMHEERRDLLNLWSNGNVTFESLRNSLLHREKANNTEELPGKLSTWMRC